VFYVAAACSDERAPIAWMIDLLTDLAQYSNVPNTHCVLVIPFLSTNGVLSGGGVSCILVPYVGDCHGYGACWDRAGALCWKLWRACWM
jgi:hypothetical protein